jgi:hypothetical protein
MLAERWDGAIDWIPFDDGKTGAGQADESAEDNEKGHDEGKEVQPFHHGIVLSHGHVFSKLEGECDCIRPELISREKFANVTEISVFDKENAHHLMGIFRALEYFTVRFSSD